MNTCAYCGREITSQDFICAKCAGPDKELALKTKQELSPTISTASNDQPISTIESNKEKQSTTSTTELTDEKDPADTFGSIQEPKAGFFDFLKKIARSDWTDEVIHEDFKTNKLISALSFILIPLFMLTGSVIVLFLNFNINVLFGIAISLAAIYFGRKLYQAEMNRLKFASWVERTVEPVEIYVYLDHVPSRAEPVMIKIYDEDNLYPDLSQISSIVPWTGAAINVGLTTVKPETLVPVKAKLGKLGPFKILLLEANGARVWCRYRMKGS